LGGKKPEVNRSKCRERKKAGISLPGKVGGKQRLGEALEKEPAV